MKPNIEAFLDPATSTLSYVIYDVAWWQLRDYRSRAGLRLEIRQDTHGISRQDNRLHQRKTTEDGMDP